MINLVLRSIRISSLNRWTLFSRNYWIEKIQYDEFENEINETTTEETKVDPIVQSRRYILSFRQQTTQRSEATNILENVLTNMLDQRVRTFLDDPNARQLQFEDSLSPFGRRYIHEVGQSRSVEKTSEENN